MTFDRAAMKDFVQFLAELAAADYLREIAQEAQAAPDDTASPHNPAPPRSSR